MAQLTTASEVISKAFTNLNTDPTLVKDSYIETAQIRHIKPILANGVVKLSDSLYQEIVDQNNTATLTADNLILLDDYIKPCLAFFVLFEVLPHLHVNTTSAGLQLPSSDFSSTASDAQRALIRKDAIDKGNSLVDKMTEFIEDESNEGKYPKYYASRNVSNTTTVNGGIVISAKKFVRIDDDSTGKNVI